MKMILLRPKDRQRRSVKRRELRRWEDVSNIRSIDH